MSPYDDWKEAGPHEDMPNAEEPRMTRCRKCREPVEEGTDLCAHHEYLQDAADEWERYCA